MQTNREYLLENPEVKRLQEFISELDEISYKYDIRIWGCGCCESPRLVDTLTNETLAEDICWSDGYSYNFPTE